MGLFGVTPTKRVTPGPGLPNYNDLVIININKFGFKNNNNLIGLFPNHLCG